MIPKIDIVYRGTYDEAMHTLVEKRYTRLTHRGGHLFASRLRKSVRPLLKRVLIAMEETSGLSWKLPYIRCYVIHELPFDFDDPMTIMIRRNMRDATETFFHELIHQLEMQNKGYIMERNSIAKKYKHEHRDTREHIFAHAVLWKVYENVYSKAKLQRIIAGYKLWPEHYKGWQIVKKEGADKIIKAYVKPKPALQIIKRRIEAKIEERKKTTQLLPKVKRK
jgi:hypothetical protein